MDKDTAGDLVLDLYGELEGQHEILTEAAANVFRLVRVICGYLEAFPELDEEFDLPLIEEHSSGTAPRPIGTESPKGAEAVRLVLQEQPGERLAVSELVGELREKGWLPESDNPANAVRAALTRLIGDPEADIYKYTNTATNRVTYSYDPDYERPKPKKKNEPGPYDGEEPF